MTFPKAVIYQHWSTGKRLVSNGISYRVGRMSYGQYFLEPGIDRGELADFNDGTLWLRPVKNNPDVLVTEE